MRPHRNRIPVLTPSLVAAVLLAAVQPLAISAQITPEQVAQLQAVSSTSISPDGRWVAYTLSQPRGVEEDTVAGLRGFSELWIAPAAGGEARAVVRRPLSASGPSWAPDGSVLGFVHRGQVHTVPAAGGEPRAITSVPAGVMAFQWSPDGRSIAFTWAPDSRRLAVQLTDDGDADADQLFRRMYVVNADGSGLTLAARTEGKMGPMSWSPDGARLAWLGATRLNDPLAQSLFVTEPGGTPRNLTPDYEGSVTWVGWQDNRTLRFVAVESTRTLLQTVPVTGGARTRLVGLGPEIFQSVSFARDGNTFSMPANTAQHPNEVYVGTLRDRRLRRVTNHNAFLAGVQLGRQETISYLARDGWRIDGVLIHPVNAQPGVRAPLAVLPHGGPEGIDFDGWNTRALYPTQLLAGAGFAVFMPNYRGSGGRGVLFSQGDHRDLAGREFDDVLDGIDYLHEQGIADRDRVGISGTSYGGYFSAWAGTRHADRFRLAMPFAGLSNWMSFTGTTDIPLEMAIVHWDLLPWEHPLLMWERSPIAHVSENSTPMVIGHGLADERVHPEQMIQLHQFLRLRGVESELVLYPREPHGLLERQHQIDYMRRILRAFDHYVRPANRPATN